MSVVVTTEHVQPRDRIEAVRDVVWSSVLRIDIDHHLEPSRIDVAMVLARAGQIGICSVRSTPVTIRRTSVLAREDAEPAVFLGLQVSGTSMIVQADREAVLRPGDLTLYDTSQPYKLLFERGIDQHFFRIPRAALALTPAALRSVAARRIRPDNPVVALTASHFARMAGSAPWRDSELAAVAGPGLDLLRAAVYTELGDVAPARDSLRATLPLRIVAYLKSHLADPDLSAARVAAAHSISVRHLYNLLGQSGIALGDWVRTNRLERSRQDLADPAMDASTVAFIAHRWGFADSSHFSRQFRLAFGTSPTSYRRTSRAAVE